MKPSEQKTSMAKRSRSTTSAFETALMILGGNRGVTRIVECEDLVRYIPIRQVVAFPWNPRRMRRCEEFLSRGQQPPAITVGEYTVCGRTYYVLSDGNHRTTALLRSGRKRIRARITFRAEISTRGLFLLDGYLMQVHRDPGGAWGESRRVSFNLLSGNVRRVLRAMGVQEFFTVQS